MDNVWAYSILIMAVIAFIASWSLPRAKLWIALAMASFIASGLQWDYGDKTLHPVFTFTCDATVCLCVHIWAQEKWELGVYGIFLMSVATSLLKLALFITDPILYASLLELWNYLFLAWVTGMGIMERIARNEGSFLHLVRRDLRGSYRTF